MSSGLTQFSDVSGQVKSSSVRQDGCPAGKFDGITIESDGRVVASYSNGQTQALAQLEVARFNSPNSLKRKDGSTFEETLDPGQPLYGLSGGSILGAQLRVVQHRHRGGVLQDDHHAAGLFGEHPGGDDLAADAAGRHQHHPVTPSEG